MADDKQEPDDVRRLNRHPRESPARRLEDYLERGQLHLPPKMELGREFLEQLGSDAAGEGAAPAAAHMLGGVGNTVWDKIAEAYETVTGHPQPDPHALRDELLADPPDERS